MTDILDPSLAALGELASQAATQHEARCEAFEAERLAASKLLETVIERVRPGLRAIASRPKISSRTFWPTNTSTATESTRAEWSGVCLDCDDPGPVKDYPRANRGSFEGSDLFLRVDGTIVRLEYEGSWSKWQGESDDWKTDVQELSPLEAVRLYGANAVAEWTERLARRCREQLDGNQAAQTKRARERAEKLEALARLA